MMQFFQSVTFLVDPALFFTTTPQDLISDGLYKALAFACYPGEHRRASMALLAQALGAAPMRGGLIMDPSGSLSEMSTTRRRLTSKVVKTTKQLMRLGHQMPTVSATVVTAATAVELSVSQQANV